MVASAGNTGDRIPQYPAAFPGVLSVGATDDGGQIADFSSYGKVDVVAPGDCVAVAVVPGVDQDRGCPGDNLDGVAFNSGTSFSAPIVSGVLALASSRSPLLARLALESSADELHPGGASDAKQWAHGLADADAFVAAHDPAAPPALVLETSGGLGSGDGHLPTGPTYFATPPAGRGCLRPGSASFATPWRHRDFGGRGEEGTYGHPGSAPRPGPPGEPPPPRGRRVIDSVPCWPGRRRPGTRVDLAAWPTTTPGGGGERGRRRPDDVNAGTPAGATASTCRSPAARPTGAACCYDPHHRRVRQLADRACGGAAVGFPHRLHLRARPAAPTSRLFSTVDRDYRLTWRWHATGCRSVPVPACSPTATGQGPLRLDAGSSPAGHPSSSHRHHSSTSTGAAPAL